MCVKNKPSPSIFFYADLYITSSDIVWKTRLPSTIDSTSLLSLSSEERDNITKSVLIKNSPPEGFMNLLLEEDDKILWEAAIKAPAPVRVRIFVKNGSFTKVQVS